MIGFFRLSPEPGLKGNLIEAEDYFKRIISEYSNNKDYNLIEVYTSLGRIRWGHYRDFDGALEYYDIALRLPNHGPVIVSDFDVSYGVDDRGYEFIRSHIYANLCLLHFEQKELSLAKEFAERRMEIVDDCPLASRVLGACWLDEFITEEKIFYHTFNDIEPSSLKEIMRCFYNCLNDNPEDVFALYGLTTSYFYYNYWEVFNGYDENGTYYNEFIESLKKLNECSKKSKGAEEMRDHFVSMAEEFLNRMNEISASGE